MTDYSRALIKAAQGLLETLASGEAHQNEQLLARAFQGWENDPRKRLRTDGEPATLATHWLSVLETARCIKGHSPLVRLLSEGFKDRQEPRIDYPGGLPDLMRDLDRPCGGDGVPEQAPEQAATSPAREPVAPTQAQRSQLRELIAMAVAQHPTARSRHAWVEQALCGQALRRIEGWEDSADAFASQILNWIDGYYDLACEDGSPVLCNLLSTLATESIGAGGRAKVRELAAALGCRTS